MEKGILKNRVLIIKEFQNYLSNNKVNTIIFSTDKKTRFLQKHLIKYHNKLNKNYLMNDLIIRITQFFNKKIVIDLISNDIECLIISYLYKNFKSIKYNTNDINKFPNISNDYDFYIYELDGNTKIKLDNKKYIFYINNLDNMTEFNLLFLKKNNYPFIIDLKSNLHNLNMHRIFYLPNYKKYSIDIDKYDLIKLWSVLSYNKIIIN